MIESLQSLSAILSSSAEIFGWSEVADAFRMQHVQHSHYERDGVFRRGHVGLEVVSQQSGPDFNDLALGWCGLVEHLDEVLDFDIFLIVSW